MNKKYALYVNEEQARVIVNALDFYSRIHIGQVEEVDSFVRLFVRYRKDKDLDGMKDAIEAFKKAAFPELTSTSSYGIHSEEVDDTARVAWDIKQVLRNVVAWNVHPEGGMTVDFDSPMKSSKQPMPEAKVVQDVDTDKLLEMLKEKFAYATECELATLEEISCRKSTSKSDISRHTEMVNEMVAICKEFHIDGNMKGVSYKGFRSVLPRLREKLSQ